MNDDKLGKIKWRGIGLGLLAILAGAVLIASAFLESSVWEGGTTFAALAGISLMVWGGVVTLGKGTTLFKSE